jgi:hypothetical protein
MAIDPEFDEMMNDICLFQAGTAVDAYGKRTFGTALSIEGRVMYADVLERGELLRNDYPRGKFLTFGQVPSINLRSKMTLPDGTDAVVLSVDQMEDEEGPHHTVITFGMS